MMSSVCYAHGPAELNLASAKSSCIVAPLEATVARNPIGLKEICALAPLVHSSAHFDRKRFQRTSLIRASWPRNPLQSQIKAQVACSGRRA
jgi:hypothetical protein